MNSPARIYWARYSAVFVSANNRVRPSELTSPPRHARPLQAPCWLRFKSPRSESVNRARRALTPSTVSTATVTTVVIIGKCQNSHTMVAADSAKIANSAAIFARRCVDAVMPASPGPMQYSISFIQVALLNDHIVKTPIAS